MNKEQAINKILENARHGTRREDIIAAYEAGELASRRRWYDFDKFMMSIVADGSMSKPVLELGKNGFVCNEALAARLWSRFSKDQCATWMEIEDGSINRFVTWIFSCLDRDEAFT